MRKTVLLAAAVAWPCFAFAQDTAVAPPEAAAPITETAPVAQTAEPQEMSAEEAEYRRQAQAFYETLNRQTGPITVASGKVTLNVPATHYFVGREDARRIIVDLWGNPPTSAEAVEGVIFLADANPALGAWGALVKYVGDGHVPDNDAATIDYAQLMRDMQSGTADENSWRRQNNYPEVTLVGWAEAPHYDAAAHKLYWAKEIAFAGEDVRTLNYDIRVLGREGHLVVSFVSTMEELPLIRESAPAVMSMANFTPGNTYADYREGVDQRAAYGIGGLIAGGALAAVAQKTGLLALLFAFGKKFIVLIFAGIAGLGGMIMRLFRRSNPS